MGTQKSKYTRLLSNTVLFGISTFSSKVLSFLLTRLYTSVLEDASFGIVDLVVAFANLLIPLVSLGIANAVIRFGLEKDISKSAVFTGGLVATFTGFAILLVCYPLMARIEMLQGQIYLLYVYVLVSCLRNLCSQFVRAKMYIRLYAVDGILSTLFTVVYNVLFLVVLRMGTTGFLLSIICADVSSIVFLSIMAKLPRYISIKKFDKVLYKKMLQYALPLVPALMFWWITSASDRFFIVQIKGPAANGLYAAASKVPSIVAILSTIFTEAWQLSAVTDGQGEGREHFFSQIFGGLMGVSFIVGSGLILTSQLIMRFLVAPSFFIAWRYIPLLVIATIFSCLVTFLNSVYMVEKRSGLSLVTMMAGAIANLILNALLIPKFGPNGAAFATLVSYVVVFVLRVITTRNIIRIQFTPIKIMVNTILLLGQSAIMIYEVPMWRLWSGVVVLLILLVNGASLWRGVKQFLLRRSRPA